MKNTFQNLKEKPVIELKKELNEYYVKLVNLKFDLSMGKVKNIQEIKETKKSIARIKGFLQIFEPERR